MLKLFFLITIFVSGINVNAAALDNHLKNHASPYLAMHGDDPVAWQEWNKNTIKRAKKEGKLIYVSSGYFSCHWCHVMQRESYKNKHVAKILNKNFIPVKIDREINSALDSRLIDFVERTQGHAGWPLNVFITPDGYPLVGMTYVPTDNFIAILTNLKMKWREEKILLENIAKNASVDIANQLTERASKLAIDLDQNHLNRFLIQANEMADEMAGGFGQQNKFPSYPQLSALLAVYKNNPEKNLKHFLLLSLDKMASQGLNDQLSGGFFRYTVDPNWQQPHFEKMLYDNALLASLYIKAASIFNNDRFAQIAKDTLEFLLNTFQSEQGAFIASLSALDDKDIEGGYYLWQRDDVKKLLNKNEFNVVNLIWKLDEPTMLENGYHLFEAVGVNEAAQNLKISKTQANIYFNSAKIKLLQARNKRNIPHDDKLLAAWNGLALSAFSKAAKQFNSKKYAKAAKNIKNYIYHYLWNNKTLVRAVKNNKSFAEAGLEDYSYVAQGLYDWLEFSENKQDQLWLEEIITQAWKRFHTKQGWLLAENSLLKYGQGKAVISDGVLPSASAILINISLKISEKNNDLKLKNKALKALNIINSDVVSQPFWYATHINIFYDYQKNQ